MSTSPRHLLAQGGVRVGVSICSSWSEILVGAFGQSAVSERREVLPG